MTDLETRLAEIEAREKAATIIRPVPGYSGYYADAFGDIWSTNSRWEKWRKITSFPDTYGYLKIKAKRDGRLIKTAVHKMVCLAWHGSPLEKLQVRHLDGEKKNNCPSNLIWGTVLENAKDRSNHGTTASGAKNGWYKTHCIKGHDLALVGRTRNGGGRACRICSAKTSKLWRANQALAQVERMAEEK